MKKRRGKKPGKVPRTKISSKPKRKELRIEELKAILARAQQGPLNDEDHGKLEVAIDTLAYLTAELEAKGASIRRLRRLIFGSSTEKTSQVVGEEPTEDASASDDPGDGSATAAGDGVEQDTTKTGDAEGIATEAAAEKKKKKRKGHGRNGAAAYTGAEKIKVPHDSLRRGDQCPECLRGKLYPLADPKVLVRVIGMAPLFATVHELERLRCNLCGEVFTAKAPEDVGEKKYDETAAAMIGLLKYGCGFPFNRLERLEGYLGIPLPSSTQWEVVEQAASSYEPVYQEFLRQAAQGKIIHNDDTTMKILKLERPPPDENASGKKGSEERTGTFTSGIVSTVEEKLTALFFTGWKHAGENLTELLKSRLENLPPPIQMCDALSRNTSEEFETILANCLAHARRKYVEVVESFPEQVKYVLETLREVYHNDKIARKQEMTPEERLLFHQKNSGPLMKKLEKWLEEQIKEKRVEPNSSLGGAIKYMRRHWKKLTLFLEVAGAPLDNNICERALKKAILHRKGSMFYKTENGARVGDLFMSLIHTCELNNVDPFDYLVELQLYPEEISQSPENWMPWNYRETLKKIVSPSS